MTCCFWLSDFASLWQTPVKRGRGRDRHKVVFAQKICEKKRKFHFFPNPFFPSFGHSSINQRIIIITLPPDRRREIAVSTDSSVIHLYGKTRRKDWDIISFSSSRCNIQMPINNARKKVAFSNKKMDDPCFFPFVVTVHGSVIKNSRFFQPSTSPLFP